MLSLVILLGKRMCSVPMQVLVQDFKNALLAPVMVKRTTLLHRLLPVKTYLSVAPIAHGFSAHIGPLRPESRGRVQLRDADPRSAPMFWFNYLSTERDWQDVIGFQVRPLPR